MTSFVDFPSAASLILHPKFPAKQLASKILTVVHGIDRQVPQKMITPAVLYEMFVRNSQCVLNQTGRCPLLVFTKQLCQELNSFFQED